MGLPKNIYLVILQVDPEKEAILGTTFDYKQAFAIAQNFLNQNPDVKSEQVFVEEFISQKELKILEANGEFKN